MGFFSSLRYAVLSITMESDACQISIFAVHEARIWVPKTVIGYSQNERIRDCETETENVSTRSL